MQIPPSVNYFNFLTGLATIVEFSYGISTCLSTVAQVDDHIDRQPRPLMVASVFAHTNQTKSANVTHSRAD